MNETIELMFHEFLTNPTAERKALVDDERATLYDSARDVELMRMAFEAGYAAAQEVQAIKYQMAIANRERAKILSAATRTEA